MKIIYAVFIYLVLWRIRVGAFFVTTFLDNVLVLAILASLATGLSVLIGATQPSNRRALMLAVLLILIPEFALKLPFVSLFFPPRANVLIYSVSGSMENLVNLPLINRGLALSQTPFVLELYLYASIQFVLTFAVVWAWRRYRK
jgi:hypothetical protein